jgi:hypothetical protein
MIERRYEPRMLCADLVNIDWVDDCGPARHTVANLEDISVSGACIQVEGPIPLRASLRIACGRGELCGVVRYCVFREIGYFIGVEFAPDSKWSPQQFKPQHLLDPRRLSTRKPNR